MGSHKIKSQDKISSKTPEDDSSSQSNLHEHMEVDDTNVGNTQPATIFLGSENESHVAEEVEVETSSVDVCEADSPQEEACKLLLQPIKSSEVFLEDEVTQDAEEGDSELRIWVPEITTTTLVEDEVVQILDALPSQMIVKTELPCCFHPCCLMMQELMKCSCLYNFWVNHPNNACFDTFTVRPPGFEDPPESEWTVVKIHQIDPSDGAVRYKCRNCDGMVEHRSTKQKFQLNISRLKYKCKHCPRKYITKKQLRLHSLRHNQKTLVCIYCDKQFLTKNELQNHLNTHTRQRPYRCPCCFQRFAHSSRYYSHIRNTHKKYDCHDCFSKNCSSANISLQKSSKEGAEV